MINVRGCEIPSNVLQADTIVVSCGLANFEQSSWSTHRRHEFWGTHGSFKDNYPGVCDGRSVWTMDYRKLDDPDSDRSLRKHIGRNPTITRAAQSSVRRNALVLLEQKYRDHDLQEWTTSLCCKRRVVVELIDPLQSTSTFRFFVALVWAGLLGEPRAGNCPESFSSSVFTTPRPEHAEGPGQHAKDPLDEEDHLPQTSKKRATSATATLAETNPSHGFLHELAERLGKFHEGQLSTETRRLP